MGRVDKNKSIVPVKDIKPFVFNKNGKLIQQPIQDPKNETNLITCKRCQQNTFKTELSCIHCGYVHPDRIKVKTNNLSICLSGHITNVKPTGDEAWMIRCQHCKKHTWENGNYCINCGNKQKKQPARTHI